MNLVNLTVKHKTFGKGAICNCSEKVVSVQFSSEIKSFIFPDAFRNHLVMADKKGSQFIDSLFLDIDNGKKINREKIHFEEEKRKLFKRLPLHSSSQIALGFIENDKQAVQDSLSVFIGNNRTGVNKGKPRTLSRLCPNSACLLTNRVDNDSEDSRCIWGVFMMEEDFIGSECSEDMIVAHKKYCITLSDEESKSLLFWNYFKSDTTTKNKWGSVEVKYFPNLTMAYILADILKLKQDTDSQEQCEDFMNYFCKLNRISLKQLTGV